MGRPAARGSRRRRYGLDRSSGRSNVRQGRGTISCQTAHAQDDCGEAGEAPCGARPEDPAKPQDILGCIDPTNDGQTECDEWSQSAGGQGCARPLPVIALYALHVYAGWCPAHQAGPDPCQASWQSPVKIQGDGRGLAEKLEAKRAETKARAEAAELLSDDSEENLPVGELGHAGRGEGEGLVE